MADPLESTREAFAGGVKMKKIPATTGTGDDRHKPQP
jgi:hypothetical protein